MSPSPISTWTLFPQVLAKSCPQCNDPMADSSANQQQNRKTRVRKAAGEEVAVASANTTPSSKKRQLDKNRAVNVVDLTSDSGSSLAAKTVVFDGPSENRKDEWFHARRLREFLGAKAALLPCGHDRRPDLSEVPVVAVLKNGQTVAIMLGEEVLARTDDGPVDRAWAELPGRLESKRATMFSVLASAKEAGRVLVRTTLHFGEDIEKPGVHVHFDVFLHKSVFSDTLSVNGRDKPGMITTDRQDLVHFVFPPSLPHSSTIDPLPSSESTAPKFTQNAIVDLYTNLTPPKTADPPASIQPDELLPQLLPFQRRSVSWLLARESASVSTETVAADGSGGQVQYKAPSASERLPFSWEQVSTPDNGQNLFINRLSGTICKASEELVSGEPEPRGGILAEEMGLGKTVEMLALILLHRRRTVAENGDRRGLVEQMSAAQLVDSSDSEDEEMELDQPMPGSSSTAIDLTDVGDRGMMDYDPPASEMLISSGATLIITPPSILHQWASEIESHAPTLKVYVYLEEEHKRIPAQDLAKFDVVLTTYPVLAKEINYAQDYDRPRRHERQYVPRQSPFVKIHWWRVCLDEAQMIEGTTVSQAAAMTLMVPRVMSWAISGTPIRRHIEDLHSLLRFLNQEPIASNKRLWKLLTAFSFRSTFVASYQRIMHRYAKRDVAHELQIPKQHRLLYGIELTEIERVHYVEVWEECLEDCQRLEAWLGEMDRRAKKSKKQQARAAPEDNAYEIDVDKLQAWLVRLRQTCCHPQIGTWSKDTLGRKNVRTIDAVLDIMLQKTSNLLNAKEKSLLSCKIRRAVLDTQLDQNADHGSKVFALFEEIEAQVRGHVEFWRARVQEAVDKKSKKALSSLKGGEKATAGAVDDEDGMDLRGGVQKEQKDGSGSVHPSVRFREWQEQHHRILFFMASTFAELGFVDKEAEYYALATSIRDQMLAVPQQRLEKALDLVLLSMHVVSLEETLAAIAIPTATVPNGSSEVLAKLLKQFRYLVELMNKQRVILEDWRSRVLETLTEPLSDNFGDDAGHGSSKNSSGMLDSLVGQNVIEAYVHHYGRMLFFRKDLLLGAPSVIANYVDKAVDYKSHAVMVAQREARAKRLQGKTYVAEEVTLDQELEKDIYDLIKPDLAFTFKSVRTMMEALAGIPKGSGATAGSANERERALAEARTLQAVMDEHTGQVELLETELENIRQLSSARSLYYRQLQGISDTVVAIDSRNPGSDMARCLEEETVISNDISKLTSKRRYLEHIAESMAKDGQGSAGTEGEDSEDRLCLICSDKYHYGLMTECGHVFCETCLTEWTKSHSKCPSCKSHISRNRLTSVSMVHSSLFKKEGAATLSSTAEMGEGQPRLDLTLFHAALSSSSSKFASDHIHQVPGEIRQVKVEAGYGSKIDSIVRHIRFLIQEDPAVKCLVFSQWSNLLHLLTDSLTINQVGFVRLDGASNKSAVHEFKTNKDKHVFMLHAKSQSAGLTLLQATHVFICEPLVNPALQAQAVSRVHRIGQTKETFVHYYLLQDTVEVPCFELFERNSATATGSNRPGAGRSTRTGSKKDPMIASRSKSFSGLTSASIEIPDDDSVDSDIRSNDNQGDLEPAASALDSATVTTASAAADSQRNNGEQVKEDDLRYCFSAQRQMAESLQRAMLKKGEEETLKVALEKGKGNKGKGKGKDEEDVLMDVVMDPEFNDPDAFLEDYERQVYTDRYGAMTFGPA